MARFTTATFTTASCAGSGGTVDHELTIPSNTLDIGRLKITPSDATGDNIVQIFRTAARGLSDLLYTTDRWTAASFCDPADISGNEYNQGWLVPYFDKDESLKLHFRFTNYHTSAKTFAVEVDYEYVATDDPGIVGAPEGLVVQATANGLTILTGVLAQRNTATIYEAEFRAKRIGVGDVLKNQDLRLVSEGGTFIPDGVDNLSVTGLTAIPGGRNYTFTSADQGRWYYAWRLKNSVGWSRWSDGNVYPQNVGNWVLTQTYEDTGPPSDWEVWLEEGTVTGTVIVHATRPKVNGNNLLWWLVQVKDGDTGAWITLDANTSPSEVHYDGSATAHTRDATDASKITKATSGWGAAVPGDLILLDYRAVTPLDFGVNFCQWGTVDRIDGNALYVNGGWNPANLTNITLKIVKPPWNWTGNGYLGLESNRGMWGAGPENNGLGAGWILGNQATEFVSGEIQIPTTITKPEARVWFQNTFCRSDNNRHSSGMSGGTALIVAPVSWTDFNNRKYWLPIYPAPTWATLTFDEVTGEVSMQGTGGGVQYHHGICGVRSRFKLHPDITGAVEVYAKFTDFVLPVGLRNKVSGAGGTFFGFAVILNNQDRAKYNGSGVSIMTTETTSGNVMLDAVWYYQNWFPSSYLKDWNAFQYSRTANIARPTAGSTVEMKWTFGAAPYGYAGNARQTQSISYRVGESGSWTTTTPTWAGEGAQWELGALELFIGMMGNDRLQDAGAILNTVSVLKGMIEFC